MSNNNNNNSSSSNNNNSSSSNNNNNSSNSNHNHNHNNNNNNNHNRMVQDLAKFVVLVQESWNHGLWIQKYGCQNENWQNWGSFWVNSIWSHGFWKPNWAVVNPPDIPRAILWIQGRQLILAILQWYHVATHRISSNQSEFLIIPNGESKIKDWLSNGWYDQPLKQTINYQAQVICFPDFAWRVLKNVVLVNQKTGCDSSWKGANSTHGIRWFTACSTESSRPCRKY